VVVLSARGLPTSLTLATIGGITGAGLGSGQPVALRTVGLVLLLAAVAPILGGLVAFALAHASRRTTARQGAGRLVRLLHRLGFGLLAIAYGANDGQKMLAVAVLALGLGGRTWSVPLVVSVTALLFVFGTLLGVRRMAGTVSTGVLPARPLNAVTAELSAGGTVLATGLFGAPVSMTQAITGALVGCGITEGRRRVRWRAVAEVGMAWVVTLPAALAVAALLGAVATRW
jgi:PiT family inorganic phosphate transporter